MSPRAALLLALGPSLLGLVGCNPAFLGILSGLAGAMGRPGGAVPSSLGPSAPVGSIASRPPAPAPFPTFNPAPGSQSPFGPAPGSPTPNPGLVDRLPRTQDGSGVNSAPGGQGNSLKQGQASWYGPGFHGKKTANGEIYDQNGMTAAMTEIPLGTWVKVVRTDTGESVVVRVNDRGPYAVDGSGRALRPLQPHPTRVIDLSKAAMERLGGTGAGVIPVAVYEATDPGSSTS